ncbi:hypothetical protein HLB02_17420 [Serratia nevei]|uniref:hypothetical protein n=1 Tax=Serratia TaxID=613 RepID=UPI0013DD65B0|nr:hypothetical protein [Serratia marcescens]MBL0875158.1 hypothetical protein [Serratia nevei]MDP8622996.1 hypothetical protein [Serratia marcescens]
MRSFTYLALIGVVALASWVGYNSGITVAANDAAKATQQTETLLNESEFHAVPASSEIVRKVQTVSNSETQSLLQEQLDVMREQLAETKVMQSRLQVISSACETAKATEGETHESLRDGQ